MQNPECSPINTIEQPEVFTFCVLICLIMRKLSTGNSFLVPTQNCLNQVTGQEEKCSRPLAQQSPVILKHLQFAHLFPSLVKVEKTVQMKIDVS